MTKGSNCSPFAYTHPTSNCGAVGDIRSSQSHSLSMLMDMNSLATYLQLQIVWLYLVCLNQAVSLLLFKKQGDPTDFKTQFANFG
ncbi:hypothetical protein DN31_1182 [Vibrio mimicus]|nr:hypothetical protein DN31_1182 [Vibrio mimicus]